MQSGEGERPPAEAAIDFGAIVRAQSGVVVASLVASFRDLDLAEEAFQDAVLRAIERWPAEGVPAKPGAWLLTTARRRAIDLLRRRRTRDDGERSGVVEAALYSDAATESTMAAVERLDRDGSLGADAFADERLRLVFTCCHPALPVEARVALTLRLLGGLTTDAVARAFQVSEATMAKRLVRAKKKIRAARIPYRVPESEEIPARLESVLLVVYLIFNHGWSRAQAGVDLVEEAIRLGRALVALLPEEPEVRGLLALMLLGESRRAARIEGEVWVPLERQDAERWDWVRIEEALSHLARALGSGRVGAYQLQAAISAKHAERAKLGATPWREIADLYARLEAIDPRAVVSLNHVVARSHLEGAEWALAELERLDLARRGRLDGDPAWHAARADLLQRAGRRADAAEAFRAAIARTEGRAERRHLEAGLDALSRAAGDPASELAGSDSHGHSR